MTEFRVLDVGCGDAGVPLWAASQVEGKIRLDGLDLDPQLIRRARDRAAQAGLSGEFKRGNALDAPRVFRPGTYDAVTAFEVIEHVPDMAVFLDALEAMVKPGGRVYLSTPEGTFGAGNNPHHLRVLRAVDLADLLRRRGSLVDMTVGSDGVSVAAYIPGPRREDVAIFTGPGWTQWSPLDIERKGLGGSETAAVRLAEALSSLGFVVTVYGETEGMCWKDVIFRHYSTFDPLESRGAVICSRIPQVADRPIAAATRMLWLHDIDAGDALTVGRAEGFDHILTLSAWHEGHVKGRYPFAADKVMRTRNGIEPSYFKPQPWADRAPRAIYSSSPDRGLDILLDLWPRIREQVPDAELHYCYADVYQAIADQDPAVGAWRDHLKGMMDQPGVKQLPSLPQQELARLMCSSRVWVHPSWVGQHGVPFHETSCIGAMEAQAAGCHVVASDWGALSETVQVGLRVDGGPGSDRWKDALAAGIVEGLSNPDAGAHAVTEGPAHAASLGWDGVAEALAPLIAAQDPGPVARKR